MPTGAPAAGGGAERTTSEKARINTKALKGMTGDPWAPVHRVENKVLTLGERDLDFRLLSDLLFGNEWQAPTLALPGAEEDPLDLVLVAEALARQQQDRRSQVPGRPLPERRGLPFLGANVAEVAGDLLRDVEAAQRALRLGVAVFAARGDGDALDKDDYARAGAAQDAFVAAVDAILFPALWARLAAMADGA